jgi:hypothetical protein
MSLPRERCANCGTLTAERLRELLAYNAETGVFINRVNRGTTGKAGCRVGARDGRGYIAMNIEGRLYVAHRLAWLYVTGEWPSDQIDHINGLRDDNRFANLREATNAKNRLNSKRRADNASGFKGVSWERRRSVWIANIQKGNRRFYLGQFATPEEAHAAYCLAAEKHHGDFARLA